MKWGSSILIILCLSCTMYAQSESFKHGEGGALVQFGISKVNQFRGAVYGGGFGVGFGKRGGPEFGFNLSGVSGVYGAGLHLGYDISTKEFPFGLKAVTDLGTLSEGGKYAAFGGVLYTNLEDTGIIVPSVGIYYIEGEKVLEVKLRMFFGSGPQSFALVPSVTIVADQPIFTLGIGLRNRI